MDQPTFSPDVERDTLPSQMLPRDIRRTGAVVVEQTRSRAHGEQAPAVQVAAVRVERRIRQVDRLRWRLQRATAALSAELDGLDDR